MSEGEGLLTGSVALVAGATRGIGRTVAESLCHLGNERCHTVAADLTSWAEPAGTVTAALGRFGRLDTAVNSAGVMLNGPSLEARLDEWDARVDLNL